MPWQTLGEAFLNNRNWYFTAPVQGELFRIRSQVSSTNEYIKAIVAPAFIDDGVNILTPHGLSYRPEAELFTFQIPQGVNEFKLAIKRLDESSITWKVYIEVFVGWSSATNQLSNIERLLMSYLYKRSAGANLNPSTEGVNLEIDTARLVVSENNNRQAVIIRVTDDVKFYSSLDETTNTPSGLIEEVKAGEIFQLPNVQGSIYQGDIYGISSKETRVSYTEYSL